MSFFSPEGSVFPPSVQSSQFLQELLLLLLQLLHPLLVLLQPVLQPLKQGPTDGRHLAAEVLREHWKEREHTMPVQAQSPCYNYPKAKGATESQQSFPASWLRQPLIPTGEGQNQQLLTGLFYSLLHLPLTYRIIFFRPDFMQHRIHLVTWSV